MVKLAVAVACMGRDNSTLFMLEMSILKIQRLKGLTQIYVPAADGRRAHKAKLFMISEMKSRISTEASCLCL